MNQLDRFIENITEYARRQVPTQTRWVRVDKVNWDDRTMECTGVADGLPYYDVPLGFGSHHARPKVGTVALVGVLQNAEATVYLIQAVEVEEWVWEDTSGFEIRLNEGSLTLNGDQFGSLMKIEQVVDRLNRLENKLNDLITKYNTHIHVTTATVGGSPTVGTISPTPSTETPVAPLTQVADLENNKIKHG